MPQSYQEVPNEPPPDYDQTQVRASEEVAPTTTVAGATRSTVSPQAFTSRPSGFRAFGNREYRALPPIPAGLNSYRQPSTPTLNEENGSTTNNSNNSEEGDQAAPRDSDDSNLTIPDMEFFDIEDETAAGFDTASPWARASRASKRLAQKLNQRLITPVQKIVVDPVARVWTNVNSRIDTALGRFGNPLMFRRLLYLLIVSLSVFMAVAFGFVPTVNGPDGINHNGVFSQQFHDHRAIRATIERSVQASDIMADVEYMSGIPHLAGTQGDYVLAKFIEKSMKDAGMRPVEVRSQHVYLTAPDKDVNSRKLQLLENGNVKVDAKFVDGVIHTGSDSQMQNQPHPFHALSSSGSASGPLVYVGRATESDFKTLADNGINIKDCIAFIRLGDGQPTYQKIRAVVEKGAVGAVTFTIDEEYPDSVMRASVSYTDVCPGDILTPGWSSLDHTDTQISPSVSLALTHIPSLPISWNDAKGFFEAIRGKGVQIDSGADLWSAGGSDSRELQISLDSHPEIDSKHKIFNVLSKIDGMEQAEKAIIVGAQRDTFCYGASDPVSGTAIMLQVAKVLSYLNKEMGWVPLRSVYFASWDGSLQNLAGSTEWVEFNAQQLSDDGVIYLQLDKAVSSVSNENLRVQGHPLLQRAANKIFSHVTNPKQNTTNMNDLWKSSSGKGKLERLNPDRDHTPFFFHAGIPSLRLGFDGGDNVPDDLVSNTCRDNFESLHLQDPEFKHHKAIAEAVAMLVLKFSDEPLIDFDLDEYGSEMKKYTQELPSSVDKRLLDSTLNLFGQKAFLFDSWRDGWYKVVTQSGETPMIYNQRNAWNTRLALLDRHLLSRKGLHHRPWFKHSIFGPEDTFPTIREANTNEDSDKAVREVVTALRLAVHDLLG